MGVFSEPHKTDFPPIVLKIDNEVPEKFPILGNGKLSRHKILEIIWPHVAEPLSKLLLPKDELKNYKQWLPVVTTVANLIEVYAYILSVKKPSGLGSRTNDPRRVQINDKVLLSLEKSSEILKKIALTEEHEHYFSDIKIHLGKLIEIHNEFLTYYKNTFAYYDNVADQQCLEAIDTLRSIIGKKNTLYLIKNGVAYFKKIGFTIYKKNYVKFFETKRYFSSGHSNNDYFNDHKNLKGFYGVRMYTDEEIKKIAKSRSKMKKEIGDLEERNFNKKYGYKKS